MLECGTAPLCAPKLKFKSLSNSTGHFLTSLRFDEEEVCELPVKLEEVGGSPANNRVGLRAPPRFSRLACDEPTSKTPYYLEVFIRDPDADYSQEHPNYSCPRRNRHGKGRRYISIHNPKKGHYCLYTQLQSTINKTSSRETLTASQEPKNVKDNSWWKTPVIASVGAILAATLSAILAWCLNKRGLCCRNTKPETDGSDAAQSNNVERRSARESGNDPNQNSVREKRLRSSVTSVNTFQVETMNNAQVGRNQTNIHFNNHTLYNFNGNRSATKLTAFLC